MSESTNHGILLIPMTYGMAKALVNELKPLGLQLGQRTREFYEGLSIGIERAENDDIPENGLLYDSFSEKGNVPG